MSQVLEKSVVEEATSLYVKLNENLDSVLQELRQDLSKREPEEDAIAFFVNRPQFREIMTNDSFSRDLLLVALYRLARYEEEAAETIEHLER